MRALNPSLLSIKQVAEALNVSTKTVRRLISKNELNHHRVGGPEKPLLRVSQDDLRAYMARIRM
jgi:excisionase family DNA binding protein